MPPQVRIRPATAADLAAIQAAEVAAGRRFAEVGMPDVAAHPPHDREEIAAAATAGLLPVVDDPEAGVVGFAMLRRLASSLHLHELAVRPDHGRRGHGAALVCHVAGLARSLGHPRLTLSTFAEVPWNRPWYERLGFRVLAEGELDAELRDLRAEEAEAGLAVADRVLMAMPVADEPVAALRIELLATEGYGGTAEVRIDGVPLRVVDGISRAGEPAAPGFVREPRVEVVFVAPRPPREAAAPGEAAPVLTHVRGWRYRGTGRVVGLEPLRVDLGPLALELPAGDAAGRRLGDPVVIEIDRIRVRGAGTEPVGGRESPPGRP